MAPGVETHRLSFDVEEPAARIVNLTRPSPKCGLLSVCPCIKGSITNSIITARTSPPRLENVKTPRDYGMEYTNVEFYTSDGVRLSAWEIHQGAAKLAIVNHPLMCTRYGSVAGMDGVPVQFLPMVKHLHDKGYNILMYDHRGQGESDGGVGKTRIGKEAPVGCGAVEWQDLVGALKYVEKHPSLSTNKIALVMQCMGANAAIAAWGQAPEAFNVSNVRCFVAVQPTISYNMVCRMTAAKLGRDIADEVQEAQRSKFGFEFTNPFAFIGSVKVPMLFTQVKADQYTLDASGINDVQAIYDACPTDKELIWIGPDQKKPFGTGKRFEGYGYFNRYPEELLAFLAKHLD